MATLRTMNRRKLRKLYPALNIWHEFTMRADGRITGNDVALRGGRVKRYSQRCPEADCLAYYRSRKG